MKFQRHFDKFYITPEDVAFVWSKPFLKLNICCNVKMNEMDGEMWAWRGLSSEEPFILMILRSVWMGVQLRGGPGGG